MLTTENSPSITTKRPTLRLKRKKVVKVENGKVAKPKSQPKRSKEIQTEKTPETKTTVEPKLHKRARQNKQLTDKAYAKAKEIWPGIFNDNPYPLKIGIREDLLAEGKLARHAVTKALHRHCTSLRYNRVLLAGATRYDKDKNPAGIVTEEQAEEAKNRIKASYDRKKTQLIVARDSTKVDK